MVNWMKIVKNNAEKKLNLNHERAKGSTGEYSNTSRNKTV